MTKDSEFEDFIGHQLVENDEGWSKQVWDAAWQACQKNCKKEKNTDNLKCLTREAHGVNS